MIILEVNKTFKGKELQLLKKKISVKQLKRISLLWSEPSFFWKFWTELKVVTRNRGSICKQILIHRLGHDKIRTFHIWNSSDFRYDFQSKIEVKFQFKEQP